MAGRSYDPRAYDVRWEEVETFDSAGRACYWMFPSVGSRFGSLVVVEQTPDKRWVDVMCLECGKLCIRHKRYLKDSIGGSEACCVQCAFRKSGQRIKARHPGRAIIADDVLLSLWMHRWTGIVSRCSNQQCAAYKNYGGRGIENRFTNAAEFLSHAITLDAWDDETLDLDRRDNDGHYEIGNLRMCTRQESANNRRSNVQFVFEGRVLTATELLECHPDGAFTPLSTFRARLYDNQVPGVRPYELRTEESVCDSD